MMTVKEMRKRREAAEDGFDDNLARAWTLAIWRRLHGIDKAHGLSLLIG